MYGTGYLVALLNSGKNCRNCAVLSARLPGGGTSGVGNGAIGGGGSGPTLVPDIRFLHKSRTVGWYWIRLKVLCYRAYQRRAHTIGHRSLHHKRHHVAPLLTFHSDRHKISSRHCYSPCSSVNRLRRKRSSSRSTAIRTLPLSSSNTLVSRSRKY